jgi:hypothetical protein
MGFSEIFTDEYEICTILMSILVTNRGAVTSDRLGLLGQ